MIEEYLLDIKLAAKFAWFGLKQPPVLVCLDVIKSILKVRKSRSLKCPTIK